MEYIIRLAAERDAEAIRAIYAPFVRDTAITFEVEPPSAEEIQRRIRDTLARFPWLVAAAGEHVLGYAHASAHRTRAAYQWAADVSVYVSPQCWRQGIARSLYSALLDLLRAQGFYSAHAGITLPNAASVGLHESFGFTPVGVYRAVGYKLGAWHDVGWWQCDLLPRVPAPVPPLALPELIRERGLEPDGQAAVSALLRQWRAEHFTRAR